MEITDLVNDFLQEKHDHEFTYESLNFTVEAFKVQYMSRLLREINSTLPFFNNDGSLYACKLTFDLFSFLSGDSKLIFEIEDRTFGENGSDHLTYTMQFHKGNQTNDYLLIYDVHQHGTDLAYEVEKPEGRIEDEVERLMGDCADELNLDLGFLE